MNNTYRSTKLACYTGTMIMSIVANITPILLITFRTQYDISYSLLGLLILVNFLTQLSMDILFSFFSHLFNVEKTVRRIPVLAAIGLFLFAIWPFIFPDAVYPGLLFGTVLYSAAGGLGEVLFSPVIASIPSPEPDREVSKLHSVYAWGVVVMVIICTGFILIFGQKNWQYLVLFLTVVPILSAILFHRAELPPMQSSKQPSGALMLLKNGKIWFFIIAMICSGAAECTMGQWASGYLEKALNIPKVLGDIFGVALFSVMLGIGRSLYAKFGKNIEAVVFYGALGSVFCYLFTAITELPLLGLFTCALTGFFTSMLWPGTLIISSDRFPKGGIFVYALMAAAGDFGASVGPQLVGVVTDAVAKSHSFIDMAYKAGFAPETFGMKAGMLLAMVFPLVSVPLYFCFWKAKRK